MPKPKKRGGQLASMNVPNPLAAFKPDIKRKRANEPITVELPSGDVSDVAATVQEEVKKEPDFNLYLGTELGVVKGIAIGDALPISKSLFNMNAMTAKPPPVISMTWVTPEEKELLVCHSNLVVKTYNKKLKCFTRQIVLEAVEDDVKNQKVVSIYPHNGKYVYGMENGNVVVWSCRDAEINYTIQTFKPGSGGGEPNRNLRKIRQCPEDPTFYGTGGRENDLQIWNLGGEKPEVPVFKARNLPHDFLDLRVPVWVEDLTFLPRTTELVAVGTRYGQVRLYDVRANPRPVSNVQFVDHPIMSITSTMNDRQVVVGTAQGVAGMYDLRNPGKEKLCLKYAGYKGSVRTIQACADQPYFVSAGLDRHLYIHKFTQKLPVKKLYVKQQINCVALSKTFGNDMNKTLGGGSAADDDWANIPPDVLDVNISHVPVDTPSPKKLRKGLRS